MNNRATQTTLQEVLDLVVDPADPLQVGTGVANYRAALNAVTRLPGMPSDLALIPAEADRILRAVIAAIEHGSSAKQIPKTVPSRLKTLFEKAAIRTATPRHSDWDHLRDLLDDLATEIGIDPKKFTPITHTLANFAAADGLTPPQVTTDWLL